MAVKLMARDLGLGALEIDPAYQRLVVKSQVNWIIKHYDEVAFGRLLVGEREGPEGSSFWVVDGQQRLTAAREMEMDRVPCLVFRSKGRQHEAAVFKQINADRASIKPMDVFKALLEAREPEAVAINAIVGECGFKLINAPRRDSSEWRNIQSVTVVRNLYRKGGTALIRRTLDLLCAAWEGDIQAVSGMILGGVGHFLQKVDGHNYDPARLLLKLKSHRPADLVRYVQDLVKIMGAGRDRARLLAGAILALYNKGLRKGKLVIPGLSVNTVAEETD